MTPDQQKAYVREFERRWTSRTPATRIAWARPQSRVGYGELASWFHDKYGRGLSITERIQIAEFMKPVMRKLRKKFPKERWDA